MGFVIIERMRTERFVMLIIMICGAMAVDNLGILSCVL